MPCEFKNQCPWKRWCYWDKFTPAPQFYHSMQKIPPQCVHYAELAQVRGKDRRKAKQK